MNVLITGASGFLGGYITKIFVGAGHRVRAFVRPTSRTDALERLGVEIVRGDLKNAASLRAAVQGMEVVVHAAATMAAPPQEYVAATVEGTRMLLDIAQEAGVRRVVHISSISVCSMQALPKGEVITEESPLESDPMFLTNYSTSKMEAERAAIEAARRGPMEVIVLRPGLLYGPRGKWNLPRMGYPVGRKLYAIIGNGRTLLPVTYVEHCAKAALLAAEHKQVSGGVFHIVDDERFTQFEYLRRLKREVRPAMKIVRIPYFLARTAAWMGEGIGKRLRLPCPIRTPHLIACRRQLTYSNDKAKQLLGWRPEVGKEEALARTMRAFAEGERINRRADLCVLGKAAAGAAPVRVCLVGCGVIAESHLKILNKMSNATVLALCDMNRDAARALAAKYKVLHSYDSVPDMLRAESPMAVHILTPPQSHAELTEIALRHNCNVLVEKPMAMNAQEARRMVDLAKERGLSLCVDHNHLYDPIMVRARKLVESGELGDIIWVDSYYGFDLGGNPSCRYMLPGAEKQWSFHIPGGLYQNLAPHPLSVALDVMGAPTRIEAKGRYCRILPHGPTDELRVLLESSRAAGMVTVSLAASPRFQYINIYGTKGAVFVDLLNKWIVPQAQKPGIPKPISRAAINLAHGMTVLKGTIGGTVQVLRRKWTPYDGMEMLIREFHASLQENRPPPVTGEEGLRVMEVMDAVWEQVGYQGMKSAD